MTLSGGLEVVSAAAYEGAARKLVAMMKYGSRIGLAKVAAGRMLPALGASPRATMVPVPPAPARERARGFDTAHILARMITVRAPGCEVGQCLVRRDGPRQVGRRRAARLSDPPHVRMSARAPEGDVWLVDDVVTTGATLKSCADVLLGAGVSEVRALTFAWAGLAEDSFAETSFEA